MDFYEAIDQHLSTITKVSEWPDLKNFFERAAKARNPHWLLPKLGCEAVGGHLNQALPGGAAMAALYVSVMLVDDMLDDDPRGEYHRLGSPTTANLALAAQAVSLEVLAQSALPLEAKLAACQKMNEAALVIAFGQHLDTQNPADEVAYWQVVASKSTPLFSTGLYLGALCGGASLSMADQVYNLGVIYGELIQIHDDFNDAMAIPANPDWATGRTSLPILFAESVPHAEQAQFRALRQHLQKEPNDASALTEAQNILIRCGAISYCVYELIRRQQLAVAALQHLPVPNPSGLTKLLAEIIDPVKDLLKAIGLSPDEILEQLKAATSGP